MTVALILGFFLICLDFYWIDSECRSVKKNWHISWPNTIIRFNPNEGKVFTLFKHQIKKCFFVIIIVCIYFLQWSLFMHKICASCSLYITYIICILLYTNIVSGWGQHWLCKPWGTRFCLMRIERQYIRPPPPFILLWKNPKQF